MTLRQIFKSRLLSNIWNQFLLYGFSSIMPILLIPYLLNIIGVEKYGLVNFAVIFSFYFQVFNEFGFDLSNVRHVVSNRDNRNELGRIVSSILQCKFFLLLCSLFIYSLVVGLTPSLRNESALYILAFIRLIGVVIAPYWLFRSMEDVKYITRVSVPVKFVCILPIFFIVKSVNDYALVMLCYALETFVSGIVSLLIVKKRYGIKFQIVSAKEMAFYLKDSLPFFSSTFLMRVYKNANTLILGFFLGDFAVGLYTAAEKLHNAYSSFVSPLLSHIFYPYFSRIRDMNRTTKMVLLLCAANT
ncbi:MAG: oligosaccharide flippase family protein, partial [Bacteroides sp.]|nr:oligosaccharide flippase family protein [Bacteroides sp.]